MVCFVRSDRGIYVPRGTRDTIIVMSLIPINSFDKLFSGFYDFFNVRLLPHFTFDVSTDGSECQSSELTSARSLLLQANTYYCFKLLFKI